MHINFSSSRRLVGLLVLTLVLGVRSGRAAAEDFLVEVWNTDSGLPHSTVTSIAQTPDGYLWVGTQHGGLARFDGTRFVNFHPGNTPELKSIEIRAGDDAVDSDAHPEARHAVRRFAVGISRDR